MKLLDKIPKMPGLTDEQQPMFRAGLVIFLLILTGLAVTAILPMLIGLLKLALGGVVVFAVYRAFCKK